jgi:tetratricopeptide (TPR) repeat protein
MRGGMEHVALNMIIGAAHFDDKRYKEAKQQLQVAAHHPELAAGALYGIGLAFGREEKMKDAVGNLLRCLQYVDQTTLPESQADALAALYENFQENLGSQSADELIQVGEALVAFLSGSGWKDRVKQARQQLDLQQDDGTLVPLAEMISIPGADRVFESMALIERYVNKKRLASALDECHRAIEYSPTYLPVHMKMAEILAMENRTEAAFEKFAVIAELYRIRGESARSVKILQQMAQIAPADLTIRAKLIQSLTAQGNLLEAIRHTVDVADIHHSLADFDAVRQSLNSALLLAHKPGIDKRVAIQILHKIGELDLQRDWRQAVKTYEQIRTQNPSDEKARVALIGLYFRLGNSRHAVVEVDDMIKHFLSIDGLPKPTQMMETLVGEHGGDVNLRQRLARLYQQAGRKDDTIVQLDAIADLYHQSGNRAETIRTIQAIIALGPDNVSEYQQLLQQIQSSA